MTRILSTAIAALLLAAAACAATPTTTDEVSLAAPPGLVSDGERANFFQDFETFNEGPFPGQQGWVGWVPNGFIVHDPRLGSDFSARHLSDGSGWIGFEIKSPLFTPAFGLLAADMCIRGDHVTYQFCALGDVPTGNDGFFFNTGVQFAPDHSIRVLQAVGGAGVFVDTGVQWVPGVPFQVATETLPSGALTVYFNAALIFQGAEASFALTGTAGRTQRFLLWTDNALGFAGESMTFDNFTNTLHAWPTLCPGDLNCDGNIDFADIDPFVAALSGEAAWTGWPCLWLNADCNADSTVDFADIDAFVARLFMACE